MVGFFRCAEGPGGGADSASPVDVVVRWCNAMARVVAMMVDLLLTQGLGYKSSGHEHGSRSHGDKRMAAMVSEECWNSPPHSPPPMPSLDYGLASSPWYHQPLRLHSLPIPGRIRMADPRPWSTTTYRLSYPKSCSQNLASKAERKTKRAFTSCLGWRDSVFTGQVIGSVKSRHQATCHGQLGYAQGRPGGARAVYRVHYQVESQTAR